jgi:hypothetical protein
VGWAPYSTHSFTDKRNSKIPVYWKLILLTLFTFVYNELK